MCRTRSLVRAFLGFFVVGLVLGLTMPEAVARTRVLRRHMVQVLVQTARRFSVPNAKVFANGVRLGATDEFGIFVGHITGYKGQKIRISVRKKGVSLQRQRVVKLALKSTDSAILPVAIKMRFQLKGAKGLSGKLYKFSIQVFALTPDRVGIGRAKVFLDGKYVGRTNKFGVWVGSLRSEVGEVLQIKVVGRGKGNVASQPSRLRLTRAKRPVPVKFHAYIRP